MEELKEMIEHRLNDADWFRNECKRFDNQKGVAYNDGKYFAYKDVLRLISLLEREVEDEKSKIDGNFD